MSYNKEPDSETLTVYSIKTVKVEQCGNNESKVHYRVFACETQTAMAFGLHW